jgi:arylsulfatase/arylsulfatase A
LKENTIVLFFTDNGPNTARYVGTFRGMKTGVHDGGIRTCFFARWPVRLRPGHKSDRIAAHIDVMPTVLAAADIKFPGLKFDGRNVLPLLDGSAIDWPERTLILQTHRGNQPIALHHVAVRSQEWKLVHPSGFGKEEMPPDVPFELYRSMDDPAEAQNLADKYPEQVSRLKQKYRDWFADVSATRENNYAAPRIQIGSEEQSQTDLSRQDWRVPKHSPGWGNNGVWEVEIKSSGPFDVIVQFEKPPGARLVSLAVGEQTFTTNLADDLNAARFESLELATGKATVSVNTDPRVDGRSLPRFVTFQHQ